jgi:hypothetical protein
MIVSKTGRWDSEFQKFDSRLGGGVADLEFCVSIPAPVDSILRKRDSAREASVVCPEAVSDMAGSTRVRPLI